MESPQNAGAARERARDALDRVAEEQLRPAGYGDVAERAQRAFSAAHQRNSVVLVGEVKRGKSALANALVGAGGASPAGVASNTAIPVVLGPETSAVKAGQAAVTAGGREQLVDAADLARWVAPERSASAASRAYVAVAGSAMGDTLVVDTPGFGGIEQDVALATANTAREASVIVVVADAASPLTRPEMDFIGEAVDRTEAVIVAVTKIDKHLTRWREIVAENRRLLAQHTGRHVPVVGVSSLLPHLGSERMARASGIDQLRDLIHARFAQAENIPAANGLRVAVEGLRELDRELGTEVASISNGSLTLPGLTADLERLENLQMEVEEWRQYLEWDISQAKREVMHALDEAVRELESEWQARIAAAGTGVLRQAPRHYTHLMAEDFQATASEALNAFTSRLETEVIASRFPSDVQRRAVMEAIEERLVLDLLHTDEDILTRSQLVDHTLVGSGISEGAGLAGAMAGLVAVTGAGAIAGLGWTAASLGLSAINQGKSALAQWLKETAAATSLHVRRSLDAVELSARPAITIAHQRELRVQIASTKKRIAEAEEALAADQERRSAAAVKLGEQQATARAAAAELEAHINALMEGSR